MQRRRPARRSAREWGVRILLALAIAIGAGLSAAHSTAYALRNKNSRLALAMAGWDGRVAAAYSRQMLTAKATPQQRQRAAELAVRALGHDPTAVAGATTLGLIYQLQGKNERAGRLFAYAERVSRRDLTTQLWLIEDAVARDDIAGALRHYDTALRTSRSAAPLLFPVLTSAIEDQAVRAALVSTLRRGPAWGPGFVDYAAQTGTDPWATAHMILQIRRAKVAVSSYAVATVATTLMSRNLVEQAWAFYAATHVQADRRRSRDERFMGDSTTPSPFDWVLVPVVGASTSMQRTPQGGLFDFSAPMSVGGALLQQVQVLPPGDYQLRGHSVGVEQPESGRPFWTLICGDGREIGRVAVPNSSVQNGNFQGRFTVPRGCSTQILRFVARPSDAASGLAGQIDYLLLAPLR